MDLGGWIFGRRRSLRLEMQRVYDERVKQVAIGGASWAF